MSDVDERIREAYRALRVPDAVKSATCAHIEAMRLSECAPSSVRADACKVSGVCAENGKDVDSEGVSHGGAASSLDGAQVLRAVSAPEDPVRSVAGDSQGGPVSSGPVRRMRHPWFAAKRRVVAVAAACAAVAAVGAGGYAYAMAPVAHVGIDVNPSFELSINRFDRVVEARAVDEEAAALLAGVDIEGMPCDEAMESLALACGAYTGEGASIEVGVACDDEARCRAIESSALRCFEGDGSPVHCGRLSDEQRRAATKAGMGMGRYRVYEMLVDAGVPLSQEDAASMPMAQLRALAEEQGVDTNDSACAGHGEACPAQGDGGQCDHRRGDGAGHGEYRGENAGQGARREAQ
ncbi:MAG: hypothetical protein Q4B69_00705 [Slackia sp.]|nr:hypothetical protein [Slackia sp.]